MFKPLACLTLYLAATCAQAVSGALLNLDVLQATVSKTICISGYTKSVRPSTSYTGKKRSVHKGSQALQ